MEVKYNPIKIMLDNEKAKEIEEDKKVEQQSFEDFAKDFKI